MLSHLVHTYTFIRSHVTWAQARSACEANGLQLGTISTASEEQAAHDVIGDFNSRRGQIGELGDKPGGLKTVKCFVPLAEMFNYVSKLRGMTKGRANYSMKLARYEPVPMNIQKELQESRGAKSSA